MASCTCDFGAALGDVALVKCAENLGQLGAVLIQRLISTGITENSLTVAAGVIAESAFTTAFAAADGTKMLVTPVTFNPQFTPGDAVTWDDGKGNSINIRRNGTAVAVEFRGVPQSTIKSLKALECEAEAGLLGVYLVGDSGNIRGVKVESGTPLSVTGLKPIPIKSLFVSDSAPQTDAPDLNNFTLALPADWSDDTVVVKGITPSKLIQDKIAAQA